MTSRGFKRGAAIAVAALAVSAVGSAAFAHTSLREANPADGSTVDAVPAEVSALLSGVVTDGSIQVFDPCGASVAAGETEYEAVSPRDGAMEVPGSRLSVATEGSKTGNYQAIWTAVGTDTHATSGLWSFDVKNGKACSKVVREDAEDNANGVDVTSVTTQKLSKKRFKVALTLADTAIVGDLASKISEDATGNVLDVIFENEQDKEFDFRGRFVSTGKNEVALALFSDDLKTKYGRYVAKTKGDILSVSLPTKRFRPEVGKHLDVFVESRGNTDDCGETGCLDMAPDLGYLRALSR